MASQLPVADHNEKGLGGAGHDLSSTGSPKLDHSNTAGYTPEASAWDGTVRDDNFYTRNGLNLESFKKRSYAHGLVELDRSMKGRHLHMIAIGKLDGRDNSAFTLRTCCR